MDEGWIMKIVLYFYALDPQDKHLRIKNSIDYNKIL
jgi:hypothetical protein